jgi:hypothetical protein
VAAVPDDVRARLDAEYPGETYYEALRLAEGMELEPRVLRSVVFLAEGDLDALRRFARRAEEDWRDVVFWAEYEDHDAPNPRRVRSMAEPFADPSSGR